MFFPVSFAEFLYLDSSTIFIISPSASNRTFALYPVLCDWLFPSKTNFPKPFFELTN